VYELTTYHVDLPAQMPTFAAVKQRYFSDPASLPAWTAVGVSTLNSPDFLVEIAARAYIPQES
jgi:enamine deaminase RidA (YjgF/YER057c/UK114 family)